MSCYYMTSVESVSGLLCMNYVVVEFVERCVSHGDLLLMNSSWVCRVAVSDAFVVIQLCSVLVDSVLGSIPLDDRSII